MKILACHESFKAFILNDSVDSLASLIETLDELLCYHKKTNSKGIPYVLRSHMAHCKTNLYQFLILLSYGKGIRFEKLETKEKQHIISFVMFLLVFGGKEKISECYMNWNGKKTIICNLRKWLFSSMQNDLITMPPPCEVFKSIHEAVNAEDWDALNEAWAPQAYIRGLNLIWSWDDRAPRNLLIYVCREYIAKYFCSYDPLDCVWSDMNRPWDYDHIFPRSWLSRDRRKGLEQWRHKLVEGFLMSIANVAPIHFSKNRARRDCPPGGYQLEDNQLLHITIKEEDEAFFKEDNRGKLDASNETAFKFVQVIASRFYEIYKTWYIDDAQIDELLDFSGIENDRKNCSKKFQRWQSLTTQNVIFLFQMGCNVNFHEMQIGQEHGWRTVSNEK